MIFWLTVFTLCQREMVRFYRQPSRVVGAVGTALLFWAVLGAGISASGGTRYTAYFFPGTIVMSVMFTCIFSNASVIEDRQAGFLQSVMTAPVSRGAIVMGKILGGSLLSTLQGLVILPFGALIGARFQALPFLGLLLSLFLLSFTINAASFWLAWKIESMPGFHTITNLVFLPLWMASGAVFAGGGTGWMKALMTVNPFTYGVAGVRRGLFPDGDWSSLPAFSTSLWILLGTGLIFYFLSSLVVEKSREGKF
jgi:ABC-2 type transport system permease protein